MPNVTTLLDARLVPESRTAYVQPDRGVSLTYRDLRAMTNRLARGLIELGVERKDRICIYLDSSAEYLVGYLASWRMGAVAVPTNIVYRERELAHAINDAGAVAIITDREGAKVARAIAGDCPTLRLRIVVGGRESGEIGWEELQRGDPVMRPVHCSFDDLCHIQYTAGTTGRPKGAMLSHGAWITALEAEREALSLVPGDVYLGIYPMGHVGCSWGLATLRAGGTWVALSRFSLDAYLTLARAYRPTVLAGMPPVIHALVHAGPEADQALRSARVIISGGGSLLPSIWEAFDRRFGIPVANAYGLSETIVIGSGTVTLPAYPHLTRGYRSVGVPVGYTEVRVVDVDNPGLELPPGTAGEIAIRGPSVAAGYWNQPEATAAVFREDGWFLTGDIGVMDEDGVLFITDRKKDMIIMSGWKIYPTEVENVIIGHDAVQDVAVYGIPDERRGEIPVAAVVPVPGRSLTLDDLRKFCEDQLAGYKIPRRLELVESLPRVHGWKLLRRTLREQTR
ncbi:MAG TPA: class I adenylate-forming enzyme family protein [Methanoregulaceae archaeon]|nr:class I adenylate-forming enzyme family protein [Methanoregulaceae archaeon]